MLNIIKIRQLRQIRQSLEEYHSKFELLVIINDKLRLVYCVKNQQKNPWDNWKQHKNGIVENVFRCNLCKLYIPLWFFEFLLDYKIYLSEYYTYLT